MPLIYQKRYSREYIQSKPYYHFVFGDNVQKRGYAGQAKEARGEPNAIGIPTKWAPSMNESAFFKDSDYDEALMHIRARLLDVHYALVAGEIVVWPEDGIGTGFSKLPEKAPRIWKYLEDMRQTFEQM